MKVTEVIDGAIEAVSGNWCQGSLYNFEGQLCLRGALYVGAGARLTKHGYVVDFDTSEVDHEAYIAADMAVEEVVGGTIPDWNDYIASSEEDVILVLKHARELVADE